MARRFGGAKVLLGMAGVVAVLFVVLWVFVDWEGKTLVTAEAKSPDGRMTLRLLERARGVERNFRVALWRSGERMPEFLYVSIHRARPEGGRDLHAHGHGQSLIGVRVIAAGELRLLDLADIQDLALVGRAGRGDLHLALRRAQYPGIGAGQVGRAASREPNRNQGYGGEAARRPARSADA